MWRRRPSMSWFRCRSCHLSSHRALPVRLAWPDRALDERSHVTPFDAVPRMPALNPVPLGGIGGGGAVAVGVAGGVVLVEDLAEQAGLAADERVLGPMHRLGRRGVGRDHEDRAGGETSGTRRWGRECVRKGKTGGASYN